MTEALEPRTLLSVSLAQFGFTPMNLNGEQVYARQGEWILQLRNVAGSAQDQLTLANKVLDRADVRFEATRFLGADGLFLINTPTNMTSGALHSALGVLNRFVSVEPDIALSTSVIPNDVQFDVLWGLHNTGQSGGRPDADIDAPEAWNIARGGGNVVVGVLDTGVDYNHVDLAPNIWINPREIAGNGRDDDGNGYIDDVRGWDFAYNDNDPMDDHGHGTHVAGTIAAAGNNSRGVVGVSWGAKILPLKFMTSDGYGTASAAVAALNYAITLRQSGVELRVINASVGGFSHSAALGDAIARLGNVGILFVAAAGNDARNIDITPNYPASYRYANTITVAAMTRHEQLAWFSNWGASSVQVAAPGETIRSTIRGGGYGYMSGTSMAAPHVAGLAALAFSYQPTASVAMVRSAIMNGVDVKSQYSGKLTTGGRINAFNTLRLLTPNATQPATATPIPAAPSDLTVTGVSATQVNLAWLDNSSIETGFRVQRSTDGVNYTTIANLGANVRSFASTGLASGTNYAFRVLAYNASGNSSPSNTVTVRTSTTVSSVPVAPANLAARPGSNFVVLTWTDRSGIEDGYRVERWNGINWQVIGYAPRNAQSFTHTGLVNGTTYFYRVAAFNVNGLSGYSNLASARPGTIYAMPATTSANVFSAQPLSPLQALLVENPAAVLA